MHGAVAQTAELPTGEQPPVYHAAASAASLSGHAQAPHGVSSRPLLYAALGGALVLLIVLAAVAGFAFGGAFTAEDDRAVDTEDSHPEPADPAPSAPVADTQPAAERPADPAPPELVEDSEASEATSLEEPAGDTEAVEVDHAPHAEEPEQRSHRVRSRETRTTPQPQPLGESPPGRRSQHRTPTTGSFGL